MEQEEISPTSTSEKMWELARRHLVSTLIMGTVLEDTQVTVSTDKARFFWLKANQIKDPQSQELTRAI